MSTHPSLFQLEDKAKSEKGFIYQSWIFFLIFTLLHLNGCFVCVCMSVHHVRGMPVETRSKHGIPGVGDTHSYEPLSGMGK